MTRDTALGLLGLGLISIGAALGLSRCGVASQQASVDKLRVCLENGGQEDQYGRCIVPGRTQK